MTDIQVRYDRVRGCGWRRPGLYLRSDGLAAPCGALPIPLSRCPCCGNGIKPTRGWTWIDVGGVLAPAVAMCKGPPATNPDRFGNPPICGWCAVRRISGRHGLLWVGGKFYPRPADFTREAIEQGVSRRIAQVPKDLVLGETWVFLAHREAIPPKVTEALPDGPDLLAKWTPGIFHVFRPSAIEYVVKGTETEDELERLVKRGITPVRVERVAEEPELLASEVL